MKRLSRILSAAACATALVGAARAQGADSCASPQVIAGTGTFNFTTGTTGTEGQNNALCNQFGQIGISRDVWFNWTAPSTSGYAVSTCGGTSIDSKIAIYAEAGGCPVTAAIACSDDSCNTQSTASFNATAGTVYKIQLGVFPGSGAASGTFSISPATVTTCPAATGPDVIVGDIQGVQNYTGASGLEALSLGTFSCNVGTQDLLWIANNNQHPVIGGGLFRYKLVGSAGRFEQVGQSWLKHGFLALTDNICCTCTGPSGSVLSVGCADPYTAARNGTQSGLGPKWQVNAHTGAFTYPPANPSYSGSTARRLQVDVTDLEVTGGTTRYFGQAQYVTPDDAAAGNQNNNASYREISVTGSGSAWTFGLLGTTQREQPAIRAWQAVDPSVTMTNVQVPGDGLFVVGSKATNLGGGQYRYEYAVYNQNSDRNGGSFSVPVGGGVSVTNIGFHDVAYLNGDGPGNVNFSGTDWVGAVSGGAVTWATEAQGVNASANAIRWGTLYNFRFDANVAPQAGNVTLGLWKTGSPGSMSVAAEVPGAAGGVVVTAFCFGDGSGTACPCGNAGAAGNGCASSVNAAGANLGSTGTPSVGADTFVLVGTGMPNSSALYFQGTSLAGGGNGTVFGDGLRCAGGSVIRLGTKVNAAGTSQYPVGGDLAISVKGANAPGNFRTYQIWYRNAAAFCTADTFNLSQGLSLTWAP